MNKLSIKAITSASILCAAISTSGAYAQAETAANGEVDSEAELDLLMMVVDEDDTPATVVNRIQLPPAEPEQIALPEVQLEANPMDTVEQSVDTLTEQTATAVTESVNDLISSGDLTDLPGDITEGLPAEDIEGIVGGVVDDIEEVIELESTTRLDSSLESELDIRSDIDSAIDDLDSSVNNEVINNDLEDLELESAIEDLNPEMDGDLDSELGAELDTGLEAELNNETDESTSVLDDVDLGL